MVSYVKSFFSWIYKKFWTKDIELAIVGLQNAGKTTLTNTLANGKFDEDTIPTIGFNYKRMKKGNV